MLCFNYIANIIKLMGLLSREGMRDGNIGICWDAGHIGICGICGEDADLITRQALHAYKVEFIHPITSKKLEIQSKLPADIQNLIS